MKFDRLCQVYLEDMGCRLRELTMLTKKNIVETKLLPYFGKMHIGRISPVTVRFWQNELMRSDYSASYIKNINAQLSSILNYAVKYFGLKENPCKKAGSIGKKPTRSMNIWTVEEFERFVGAFEALPVYYCGYHILFWCGMRIGELLALTWNDVDLETKVIRINKSYQRIQRKDVITPPKTEKSNRRISIDVDLAKVIVDYRKTLHRCDGESRVIPLTKHPFERRIRCEAEKLGLKPIRLHDLRHSHVSFLINNGISPLAIAKRVGHDKVETTLSVYSHLYPVKEEEIIDMIQSVKRKRKEKNRK